jgi:lysyl-tRNA synthetase class 1
MLNLVSAGNASDREVLWGFLTRYIPGATPESEPLLDRLVDYAMNYYEDFVAPTKAFRAATDQERAAMEDLLARFPRPAGRLHGRRADPVRGLRGRQGARVRSAAPVVPGALRGAAGPDPGPRFGSFAAIFGLDKTIQLIEDGLAGKLLAG